MNREPSFNTFALDTFSPLTRESSARFRYFGIDDDMMEVNNECPINVDINFENVDGLEQFNMQQQQILSAKQDGNEEGTTNSSNNNGNNNASSSSSGIGRFASDAKAGEPFPQFDFSILESNALAIEIFKGIFQDHVSRVASNVYTGQSQDNNNSNNNNNSQGYPDFDASAASSLDTVPTSIYSSGIRRTRTAGGNPYPEAGSLDVCTLMCIGDLCSPRKGEINLTFLADQLHPCATDQQEGIRGLLFGDIAKGNIQKKERLFGNQVQLHVEVKDNPNVIVKVFSTGKLHITGCKDVGAAISVVKHVAAALKACLIFNNVEPVIRIDGVVNPDLIQDGPSTVEVVNANCTFDTGFSDSGYHIVLDRVPEEFRKPRYGDRVIEVTYERIAEGKRGGYPGCKLYLKRVPKTPVPGVKVKSIFVGIFTSGKVVITGAPSLEEAHEAYNFVKEILREAYEVIRTKKDGEVQSHSKKSKIQ